MPTIAHTAADGGERLPRTPQVQAGSCWVIRWVILCHTILRHTKYKSSYRWLSVGIGRVNFRSYTNLVRQAMTSYDKLLEISTRSAFSALRFFQPGVFSESGLRGLSERDMRHVVEKIRFQWFEMTWNDHRLHEASRGFMGQEDHLSGSRISHNSDRSSRVHLLCQRARQRARICQPRLDAKQTAPSKTEPWFSIGKMSCSML